MASAETDTRAPAEVRKFPLTTLIAMVIGSMVGAGIFSLPRNFALATGVYGALVAWVIAGTGMLMLAFVFQTLAVRKPDLDAGVYAYAKAGYGEYLGFFSAWGYWASACIGNVTYWVLVTSTLGRLWPGVFGDGDTVAAFGVAASAVAASSGERGLLSIAAVAYAAVTGITLNLAGHVQRRISLNGAMLLDRLAGILLTAIAVILLANGFTDLVLARIHRRRRRTRVPGSAARRSSAA